MGPETSGKLVAKTTDIPTGTMVGATLGTEKILLANVDGQIYAMRSVCNHMGGPLEEGTLEGGVVTCPLHGSRWDVKTGKLVEYTKDLPDEPTYRVTVKEDQVLVET